MFEVSVFVDSKPGQKGLGDHRKDDSFDGYGFCYRSFPFTQICLSHRYEIGIDIAVRYSDFLGARWYRKSLVLPILDRIRMGIFVENEISTYLKYGVMFLSALTR